MKPWCWRNCGKWLTMKCIFGRLINSGIAYLAKSKKERMSDSNSCFSISVRSTAYLGKNKGKIKIKENLFEFNYIPLLFLILFVRSFLLFWTKMTWSKQQKKVIKIIKKMIKTTAKQNDDVYNKNCFLCLGDFMGKLLTSFGKNENSSAHKAGQFVIKIP